MNKIGLYLLLIGCISVSCNENEIFEKEQYKTTLYLLSNSDQIYTEAYSLNNEESVKYLSIGCGGSNLNEEEVKIELELDTVLLKKYNKSNFDIDTASFARLLPADRYKLDSMTATLPAHCRDSYVKVPITVRAEGLSPDSTYFIPLAIKKVSEYEVNPEKFNVLYRVAIENDYAEQLTTTYYQLKGSSLNEANGSTQIISGTKPIQPLTRNKIRVFVGAAVLQTSVSKVPDFIKNAIVVQVNQDSTLTITPYGTIDVQQLPDSTLNVYQNNAKDDRRFLLYYRYRTLTTPATATTPAVYSGWFTIKETLKRLE